MRSAQQALGVLTRAAVDALSAPTGPVSVEVPIDLQRVKIERPAMLDNFVLPLPPPRMPTDVELDELAARVMAGEAADAVARATARSRPAARRRNCSIMGFCMVNSFNGRGTVPEDASAEPRRADRQRHAGRSRSSTRRVDLLLVVGCRLRGHETGDFDVKLPANIVQIDSDPMANGRTYRQPVFRLRRRHGDVGGVWCSGSRGGCRSNPATPRNSRELKRNAQRDFIGTLGVYGTFSRATAEGDATGCDLGARRDAEQHHLGQPHLPDVSSAAERLSGRRGHRPGTVRLASAPPRRPADRKTVVMTGDGGFFLNVGELWTAVQEKLDMTVIVMNDRGYGVIKRIQDATAQGRRFFADLQGPDLGRLAAVSDIPYLPGRSHADTFGDTVAQGAGGQGADDGGSGYDRGRRVPALLSVQPEAGRLMLHAGPGAGVLVAAGVSVQRGPAPHPLAHRGRRRGAADRASRCCCSACRRRRARCSRLNDARHRVAGCDAGRHAVRVRLSRRGRPAVRRDASRRQFHPGLPGAAAGADDQRAGVAAVPLGRAATRSPRRSPGCCAASMGIGGPLALGAAVHVFVGMVEAPLLVRPYLARMQRGELFALMTCGMAGVAGTVMVIYASFLAPIVPNALGNILIASVISTPAGLAVAALMVPFDGSDRAEGRLVHRGPAAQQPGCAGEGHAWTACRSWRRSSRVLLVTVALVTLVNMALGLLPDWGGARGHAAAPVRPAVPPGDVADRRALGGDRRRRDADGDQDGAERVRRLSGFFHACRRRRSRRAPA